MNPEECYAVLGLDPTAPMARVREAYKKLALKHHPDLAGDSPEILRAFSRISTAYRTLRSLAPADAFAPGQTPFEACASCSNVEDLFDALDGSRRCAACLLDQRRKRLTGPALTTARCLGAILLQLVAIVFLIDAIRDGDNVSAFVGLAVLLAALIVLTRDVLRSTIIR